MTEPPAASVTDDARYWFDAALELDAENRRLRELITDILLWIIAREDLLEFVHAEIAARWPETEERVAA